MNFLFVNQYAGLPTNGYAGRSFYISRELSREHNVTLLVAKHHHQLRKNDPTPHHIQEEISGIFRLIPLWVFKTRNARGIKRVINWFVFMLGVALVSKRRIGFVPQVIIYSSPSLLGFIGAYIAPAGLIPGYIFEVRDIWPLTLIELGGYNPKSLVIRLFFLIERFAVRNSDGVISNLRNVDKYYEERGIEVKNFHFSPNGIPGGFGKSDISSLKDSRALKITEVFDETRASGGIVVCYCGGLSPANAMDLFVGKFASVQQREYPNLRVLWAVVGEGPLKCELRNMALGLGLTNIKFFPGVDKNAVPIVLSSADILFLANPFLDIYKIGISPLKLPEYILSQSPIVHVTNSDSLVNEHGAGIVVTKFDEHTVVKAVASLAKISHIASLAAGTDVLESLSYRKISENLVQFLGAK